MFCSKCGAELTNGSIVCSKCGKRLQKHSYLKLSLIVLIGFIVLIFAGHFIIQQIKILNLNRKLEESVGKDAGYTETILKVEKEASNISYEELFNLCDKSIEFRTNLIVDLRGLYPDLESELRDKLIDFLNDENELIRQKKHFYRKRLSYYTTTKLCDDLLKDMKVTTDNWQKRSSGISILRIEAESNYWKIRANEMVIELNEAFLEMGESADDFISTYNSLVDKESSIKKLMESKGLRFVGFIEKYHKENLMLVDEIKEQAQSINL